MNANAKSTLKRLLRYRFGIDVARWPRPDAEWRALASLLERLDVGTVLDIGAHHGESGVLLRRVGYRGELISFEPAPAAFRRLERVTEADPRWRAVPLALGSRDDEQELALRSTSVLSSFLPTRDGLSADWQTESVVSVPVRRLDAVLDDYVTGSAFAKIDTQGYDLEVIRGAAGVIHRLLGLHVELTIQPSYVGQPDYLSVLTELRSLGFEPVEFFKETVDRRGRLREINGLFVRD